MEFPPWLLEIEPETDALSLVELELVGANTPPLLAEEPPLTSDWPWMAVEPLLAAEVLSPLDTGATLVVCAPLVVELLFSAPATAPAPEVEVAVAASGTA